MSLSRKDLISQYDIQEKTLMDLLNALCEKPESANNLSMIKNALRGDYSDFGSRHDTPLLTLAAHLEDANYHDLVKRVYNGDFDHNSAPKPYATHANNKAAADGARQEQKEERNNFRL